MRKYNKKNGLSIIKKYSVSIEQLDKNAIIQFKEEMKKLSDSRQKSKCSYKIWDIVVTAFIAVLANQKYLGRNS